MQQVTLFIVQTLEKLDDVGGGKITVHHIDEQLVFPTMQTGRLDPYDFPGHDPQIFYYGEASRGITVGNYGYSMSTGTTRAVSAARSGGIDVNIPRVHDFSGW
jgi:hypothetical protein